MERILVATDDSPPARAAVRTAVSIAAAEGAELVALAVVGYDDWRVAGLDVPEKLVVFDVEVSERDSGLERTLAAARACGVPCSERAVVGDPAEAIIAVTKRFRPDLVVLGSRVHGRLHDRLHPHLADRVAHCVDCDVVVVIHAG